MAGLVNGTLVEMADQQMKRVEDVQKGDIIWDPHNEKPVKVIKHLVGQVNTVHGIVSICKYMGLCAAPKQVIFCNRQLYKLNQLVPVELQEVSTVHCLVLQVGGRCVKADGVVCISVDENDLMKAKPRHVELKLRGIEMS